MNLDQSRDLLIDKFESAAGMMVDGLLVVDLEPDEWIAGLTFARDELNFGYFDWLSCVDELDSGVRVIAHVYSVPACYHLLIRCLVRRTDLCLPTAAVLFSAAGPHELAVHETFGLEFSGHPSAPGDHGDSFPVVHIPAQRSGEFDSGYRGVTARGRTLPLGLPDPALWSR